MWTKADKFTVFLMEIVEVGMHGPIDGMVGGIYAAEFCKQWPWIFGKWMELCLIDCIADCLDRFVSILSEPYCVVSRN